MSVSQVPPLRTNVKIVDENRGPTPAFIRWWGDALASVLANATAVLKAQTTASDAAAVAADAVPQTRLINTTSPIAGGGPLTTDITLTHATSGVTAASYTNANITVDAKGHITTASNGSSGSTGTVTSVSVTTAHGVSATVANPTTTPALTFTLGAITPTTMHATSTVTGSNLSGTNTGDQTFSITGDGTAAGSTSTLALTVTKLNGVSLAGLATGILKNTTTTGVPSIAVAADFPTLNQNTTGSAATLTTARNFSISGGGITAAAVSFDGSAAVALSASVDAGHITLARMASVATGTVFYRKTAGTGDPEVQTLATLKTDLAIAAGDISGLGYFATGTDASNLTGTVAVGRFPALTGGDVTSSAGSGTLTIGAATVTLAKMANLAANSIIGNNTGSPATPIALTVAQTKTLLAISTSDVSGLGTSATHATGDFLQTANNLSDAASRSATLINTGAFAGNVVRAATAGAAGTGAYTPSGAASNSRAWSTEPTGFYFVRFDDGAAWELHFCYWNGTTLSRSSNQLYDSSTGSQLSLTSAAIATKLGHPFEVIPPGARFTRQWVAGPSLSAPTAVGMSAPTATGTGANVAQAATNYLTEMPGIKYTSATTANAQTGLSYVAAVLGITSTTAGRGGWEMEVGFGATTVPTGPRLFIGVAHLTFVGNTGEPSAFTSHLAAFGLDSTDTNIQVLTNSNAGGTTKIDTGIAFAVNQLYRGKIWTLPGSNKVYAILLCPDTGAIFYTSTTTDVPATGSGIFPHILGGLNGSNTGTAMVMQIGTMTLRTGQ